MYLFHYYNHFQQTQGFLLCEKLNYSELCQLNIILTKFEACFDSWNFVSRTKINKKEKNRRGTTIFSSWLLEIETPRMSIFLHQKNCIRMIRFFCLQWD